MPEKAWDRRGYGDFKVDVRLCNGRNGFPSIGSDELNGEERERLRARLLSTVQLAIREGVLSESDLAVLANVGSELDHRQVPLPIQSVVRRRVEGAEVSSVIRRAFQVESEVNRGR